MDDSVSMQPEVVNMQGLQLSPDPYQDAPTPSSEDGGSEPSAKKARDRLVRQKQEELERMQAENERKAAYERNMRHYMSAVATQNKLEQAQGQEGSDPEALMNTMHMAMDAMAGGIGISSLAEPDMGGGKDRDIKPGNTQNNGQNPLPIPQQPARDM